jgi:tetratricopeptide (TPR) repeat protein
MAKRKEHADLVERIQKYQKVLQKDPRSPLFINLADALIESQNHSEALKWIRAGLKYHPQSVTALILEAKVYLKMQEADRAIASADKALELANDNLLAYQIKGDAYLLKHDQRNALAAFKMLLFLSPQHEKAQLVVKKLESFSAQDYDEDLFSMKKISSVSENLSAPSLVRNSDNQNAHALPEEGSEGSGVSSTSPAGFKSGARLAATDEIERTVSLVDAFIARNDIERAAEILADAEREFGSHPDFLRRRKILSGVGVGRSEEAIPIRQIVRYPKKNREEKIRLLEKLLQVTREKAGISGL